MNIFNARWRQHKIPAIDDGLTHWVEATWAPSPSDEGVYRYTALQPIFTRRRQIFGYEALSRSGWNNCFSGDSNAATRMMIDNWLLHSLGELTGEHPAFMNCTREALLSGILTNLPRLTVLELLETIEPDKDVVAACRKMRGLGYRIALDDFQLAPNMERLVEIADYVKIDFRLSDRDERKEIFRCLKYSRATAIAEKVETQTEFETAIGEGFSLFQGFYLGRPIVFSKREIPVGEEHPFRLQALYR